MRNKLRHKECEKRSPSPLLSGDSRGRRDRSYHHRFRTPSGKSYSASMHRDRWERSSHDCEKRPSHHSGGNDAMSKALQQISKSPFVRRINKARLPRQFSQPTFAIHNGRTDPVEHVSHFNQKMVIHAKNEALMCKVFPSSLRPMAMRWFDALGEGII